MAIDSKDNTSSSAKYNDIIDWIEWDDEKKHFLSIFRNKIECSECGKEIKGEVKFKLRVWQCKPRTKNLTEI